MPKVSFIIPVYNAESTIDRTLDSILAQKMRDFEVLTVDDGSSDGTPAILERRAQEESRIRVLKNPENRGVSAARNLGLDRAAGEYIRFVDADDTVPARSTPAMVRIADKEGADMVMGIMRRQSPVRSYNYGRTIRVAEKKRFDKYDKDLIHSFSVCNKLFRRSVIEAHAVRFEAYKHAEDGLFLYTFLQYADRLCGYKGIAYVYNKSEFFEMESATRRLSREMLEGILEIADRILAMHPQAPQRFLDDFRARILGVTLINEYYRQLWRLDGETPALLLEQIGKYWALLPEKQRREVAALNRDLPAPDKLGGKEEICAHPLFEIEIGEGVSAEMLPMVLQSLYYQKLPYFRVLVHPAKAAQVPAVFAEKENLFLADAAPPAVYRQRLEEDLLFTYESLSRACLALQKEKGAIRGEVRELRGGRWTARADKSAADSATMRRSEEDKAIAPGNSAAAATPAKRKEVIFLALRSPADLKASVKPAFRDSPAAGQLLAYASMVKRKLKRK